MATSIDVPWTLDVMARKDGLEPRASPGPSVASPTASSAGVGSASYRRRLPRGTSLDDWVAANVPAPTQSGNACRFGFAIVGVPTGSWQEVDIGGHPGRIRDGCEVDAVVVIGRRVYVMSARSLRPETRISNLKQILGHIEFRPEEATAP